MKKTIEFKSLIADRAQCFDVAKDQRLNEQRCCPACGGSNYAVIETMTNLQFYTDLDSGHSRVTYAQVMCKQCDLLYMNPCYTDKGFQILFALAGRSYGDGGGRHDEQLSWLQTNHCIDSSYTYVDIGCFEGDFLLSIPGSPRLIGIDFDEGAISRAREKEKLKHARLIHGRFEDFCVDERVDVYTMFHVLEHLPDPVAVLKRLVHCAHGNTSLIVEVPVLEKGKTNDIHGFYSPQHLTHFSKATLSNVLKLGGWSIISSVEAEDYNGYRLHARPGCDSQQQNNQQQANTQYDLLSVYDERSFHYQSLVVMEKRLQQLPDTNTFVIWGAGMHLEYLLQKTTLFQRLDGSVVRLVDSDPLKQGKKWRGIVIEAPSEVIDRENWASSCLVISSYGGQPKICQAALSMGVPDNALFRLYETVSSY